MDIEECTKILNELKLTNMKTTKGILKETIIGDDGKKYEIEREIELPYFEEENE